ncbi:MAG: GntR family transcriptional regulator [Gemmatimonadetes bacterium]|jgi:DNA-binding GntR family transcriptional regulator|nr:GntR family transcriptional regulator [Gemmatimonadota bacterium]
MAASSGRATPTRRTTGSTGSTAPEGGARSEGLDNVSRAYEELRHIIVWGQIAPGSRISERIVAERLGLSRTPVRSALHRLEQEGFVSSVGRDRERRLIVAPLTMSDGLEVYSIVGHLEGLAARTAAELPLARRKEIVARLRAVNRQLADRLHHGGDAADFFDLDIEFHRTYVEGVVGPRLLTLHRAIKPQGDRYTRLYVSVLLGQVDTSVYEHEKIAAAIGRGDADAAQHATETNWHNAAERLTHVIARHGEQGNWGGFTEGPPGKAGTPRPGRPLRETRAKQPATRKTRRSTL